MTTTPEVVARAADVDDVHARTREVCGRLNRAHAELVDIMGGLLETGLWAEGGIRTPEHWLIVRAGLAPARARDIVTMARRRADLPETSAALMAGRLSMDQAAVVAQHVPATHSRAANALAEKATVTQLRRVLPTYAYADDASDTTPNPIEQAPRLTMFTRDGRFHLRYDGPETGGALIEKSIREAKDALFTQGQTDATLADGLVEVTNRSLSTVASSSRASKFRIYVHLDTDGGWIERGGRLPKHMIDRLTCDGVLQPVWESGGHPVNVGRAQRIVPRRTRRLVEARDRGCRFPGCATGGGHVEVHHIRHWRNGGQTNTRELVCLCPAHHDAHHDGEFAISGNADDVDGLAFTGRGGWPIEPLRPELDLTDDGAGGRGDSGDSEDRDGSGRGGGANDPFQAGRDRHLRLVDEKASGPEPPRFTGPLGERLHTKWIDFPPNDHPCWTVWPRAWGGDSPDDSDPADCRHAPMGSAARSARGLAVGLSEGLGVELVDDGLDDRLLPQAAPATQEVPAFAESRTPVTNSRTVRPRELRAMKTPTKGAQLVHHPQ